MFAFSTPHPPIHDGADDLLQVELKKKPKHVRQRGISVGCVTQLMNGMNGKLTWPGFKGFGMTQLSPDPEQKGTSVV